MKFLVDAQLPRRLAHLFSDAGHETVHTIDLPHGNRTTDEVLNDLAVREERVVITKDADFVNSFLVFRRPPKLLLISTGNISNSELLGLLGQNLAAIVLALETNSFVELDRTSWVIHV